MGKSARRSQYHDSAFEPKNQNKQSKFNSKEGYKNQTDYISDLPSFQSNNELYNMLSPLSQSMYSNAQLTYQNSDYSNNYVHTETLPTKYIRNIENTVDGYPKLQLLLQLKQENNEKYFTKPFGVRCQPEKIAQLLTQWIVKYNIVFDTIMIGSLTENQFTLPILTQLPIDKLCSKPGFLYIWDSGPKIHELANLLNGKNEFNNWSKKFRRSEELVFTQGDSSSHHFTSGPSGFDDNALFTMKQWHCWMCITGTVRRSYDAHLINCNVNTDLKIQDSGERRNPSSVPDSLYKVAENFASGNRRLHIITSRSGTDVPVKARPGWVIVSPDILLDNFDPQEYKSAIQKNGYNVDTSSEIESLRPKSPLQK